jgi:hypothetical protein
VGKAKLVNYAASDNNRRRRPTNSGSFKKGFDPRRKPGGPWSSFDTREVIQYAREYSIEAVNKLVELMHNGPAPIQLAAACALLDRAHGRPAQAVAVAQLGPPVPAIEAGLTAIEAQRRYLATLHGDALDRADHGPGPVIDGTAVEVEPE